MYPTLLLLQQEAAEHGAAVDGGSLLSPNAGLMVWTLLIFLTVWFILSRFAFPRITEAVRAREQALQEAIEAAQRDREEAQRLLAEQKAQLDAARDEAARLVADGRAAAEQVRSRMIEETRAEQAELLERARREIAVERDQAIAALRREAVDLAIAAASRVIERNLDEAANRELVERFLASIPAGAAAGAGGRG